MNASLQAHCVEATLTQDGTRSGTGLERKSTMPFMAWFLFVLASTMAQTEEENAKEYSLFIPIEQSRESLLLTPTGHNQFRLEESSLTEIGLFYHDIIEVIAESRQELRFIRLVERSGLRVFFFLLFKKLTESELFAAFLQRVEAHSGYWEQIFGGMLLVHLPRGSACRPKSELRALLETLNEASA